MAAFLQRQRRYREILGIFARHDMTFALEHMGLTKLVPEEYQVRDDEALRGLTLGEHLRVMCEELGPTFVKMGQILATRPDLIGPDTITELRKLQDEADPVPWEAMREVIEAELEAPVSDVFAEVDEQPMAAASIAQVHHVTLKDGRRAVLKVQRPGIEQTIRMDIAILRHLAELARGLEILKEMQLDPVAIVKEFERTILRELDFVQEARTTDFFRTQHARDPEIKIADVYWPYTRKRVMCEELIEGVKVSDRAGLQASGQDLDHIARKLVQTCLEQTFLYGHFHADPHPGNLIVLADGRLAMIDFGMSGHFDRYTLAALSDMLKDVAAQDYRALVDHLLKHGLVGYDADLRRMRGEARDLLRVVSEGGSMEEAAEGLMRFVVVHRITFPPDLFFLDKIFGTLDGAVKALSPTLSLRQVATEYAPMLERHVLDNWQDGAKTFVMRLLDIDQTLLDLPGQVSRVLQRLDAGFVQLQPRWGMSDQGSAALNRLLLRGGGVVFGSTAVLAWALAAGRPGGDRPLSTILLVVGLLLASSSLASAWWASWL